MIFPPKSRYVRSAAALSFLAAGAALACGPYFPSSILVDRASSLKAAPKNSFAFEAMHLVAKGPGKAVEANPYAYDSHARQPGQDQIERAGLKPEQISELDAMRKAGDSALALAGQLPRAIAVYTAGAVDFQAGHYADARNRFAQVLAMPPAQARPRVLWAAYSMGRADAALGDAQRAAQDFAEVRQLAGQGVADPLGLAVASLGEEARLHFRTADALLTGPPPAPPQPAYPGGPMPGPDMVLDGDTLPPGRADTYGREMRQAAALYARQAAYQSDIGVESLKALAANIVTEPARLDATITDPLIQRLVVAYALARDSGDPFDYYASGQPQMVREPAGDNKMITGQSVAIFARVIDAVLRNHIAQPAAADRLAALAYRAGRFDLAGAMAQKSASPLAEWVQGKLALQAGDLAGAQAHYAAALRARAGSAALSPGNATLLAGESGAVALAREQYLEALRLFMGSGQYWRDSAYIAERVLSTDDLKAFVDKGFAGAKDPSCMAPRYWDPNGPLPALRDVLARRLMREGRADEALRYYCLNRTREFARSYGALLRASRSGWDHVRRARQLFDAAVIAREHGMEIMGTERSPDYAIYYGDFGYDGIDAGNQPPHRPEELDPADRAFISADEMKRAAVHAPSPDLRFHYRYVAAQEAEQAASLLPPRSQAFAAVLCKASGWMLDAPDGGRRGWRIYQRYVRQGAYIPWHLPRAAFGRQCPQPDFGKATLFSRLLRQTDRALFHHRRIVLVGEAGFAVLMVLGLGLLARKTMRRA